MGLEVNYDEVADQAAVWRDDPDRPGTRVASPVATVVAVETLVVGLSRLTTINADTFYRRSVLAALARGKGPWVQKPNRPIQSTWVTRRQVLSMVGLQTNAPDLAEADFQARVVKDLHETADRVVRLAQAPDSYQVTVTVSRKDKLAGLCAADRQLWAGYRGRSRAFHFDVVTHLTGVQEVGDLGLARFRASHKFTRLDDFLVQVTAVDRLPREYE